MSEDPQPKPKLIIDEDWKTQVEREKEALKQSAQAAPSPVGEAAASPQPQARTSEAGTLPPPSISLLVTMLATQAMAALGVLRDPHGGEPQAEPEVAKHFIDLLGVLEDKTKGNLSREESSLISQTLHELRMMFVTLGR